MVDEELSSGSLLEAFARHSSNLTFPGTEWLKDKHHVELLFNYYTIQSSVM